MTRRPRKNANSDIAPDEIFLDARNIPEFDVQQFEGRMEAPIERRTIFLVALVFTFVGVIFLGRAFVLQLVAGEVYALTNAANPL